MPSSTLTVTIVAGRELAAKDSNGLSDPYVYVWTVPELDSKTRLKSKTIFKSLNPAWEETFEFEVDPSNPDAELKVEVWDYDRWASDDFMGAMSLPMHSFVGKQQGDEWYELGARPNKKDEVSGSIRIKSHLKTEDEQIVGSAMETKEREKRFIDIVDPKTLKSLSSQERKRQEILFELINTEEQYVNDLRIIINSFLLPLQEQALLSPAEISAVFSNVQSILPVNEGLLKALKKRQEDNPVIPHIGDVLLAHVDLLHVYTVYCSNQTMASVKVDELRTQYPLFASFVDRPREECRRLPLTGFLVKPLQRLCKYPLLLRELTKDLPESHADYKDLTAAFQKVKSIVDQANERTRQVEQLVKLQTIRELLTKSGCTHIIKSGRQVLEESRVTLTRNGEKSMEVLAILFNDMCFLAKQKKDSVTPIAELPLTLVSVRSLPNKSDQCSAIEFRLVNDVWVVDMNSADERSQWLKVIADKKAIGLYEEVVRHGEALQQLDAQSKSAQALIESGSEVFDMKVKLVELVEMVKKERSLRHLADLSLADSQKQVKELTQKKELLQLQLDQAVDSFATLEKNSNSKMSMSSSASSLLIPGRAESSDSIGRNKSPLPFKNPLRSGKKKDMEMARPGGSRARMASTERRDATPTSPSADAASKELEEKLKREKKRTKRLQVRAEELEAKVAVMEQENQRMADDISKAEAKKPSEYLQDKLTAMARQNEMLEKQIKELKAGEGASSDKPQTVSPDVIEALRREITKLREENKKLNSDGKSSIDPESTRLRKRVAELEKELASANKISAARGSSPTRGVGKITTKPPASAAPSIEVSTPEVFISTSTAATVTSSGETLAVLKPAGSRSKTPSGMTRPGLSVSNSSSGSSSSGSSTARSKTPILRPPGYKEPTRPSFRASPKSTPKSTAAQKKEEPKVVRSVVTQEEPKPELIRSTDKVQEEDSEEPRPSIRDRMKAFQQAK